MTLLASFTQDLQQPEYLHVLLNPMPVYALAMGVLALGIALFLRARPAKITALTLIAVSALSAWPVSHYGEEAYDRVLAMSDDDGGQWLKAHMERAEKFESVFYVLGALALIAIVVPIKWPQADTPLAIVTLLLAIGTMGLAVTSLMPAGRFATGNSGMNRRRRSRSTTMRTEPRPSRSMNKLFFCLAAMLALTACATPPPALPPENAANPNAGGSRSTSVRPVLAAWSQPYAPTSPPTLGGAAPRGEEMRGMTHDHAAMAAPAPKAAKAPEAAKAVYTCVMHPEVQQDAPGKCPICGMTLVLKKAEEPKP